jgi:hypothetical protein
VFSTRSIARLFILCALSVLAAASCIGLACVALGISFYRYAKPLEWPSSNAEVVIISQKRVPQASGSVIASDFVTPFTAIKGWSTTQIGEQQHL